MEQRRLSVGVRAAAAACCLAGASGCATLHPAHLGQVLGTIVGGAAVPGIGAPVGGALGMVAGMLLQQEINEVTSKQERIELTKQIRAPSDPATAGLALTPTEPVRVWVDESWADGRLIAGHFEERYLP